MTDAKYGTPDTLFWNGVQYDLLSRNWIEALISEEGSSNMTSAMISAWLNEQYTTMYPTFFHFMGNSQGRDYFDLSLLAKFNSVISGELTRSGRISGAYGQFDNLMNELNEAMLARQCFVDLGDNYYPFALVWADHGGSEYTPKDWNYDSATKAFHRMMTGFATIFDGYSDAKKDEYFFLNQSTWIDEFAVNTSDRTSVYPVSGGVIDWSQKHWLGLPLAPPTIEETTLATNNLLTNASFESVLAGTWTAQNVSAARVTTPGYVTHGSYSVRLMPSGAASGLFYQTGRTLAENTWYTFSFDVRNDSDIHREISFQIVNTANNHFQINHDPIYVGDVFTTYRYSFYVEAGEGASTYSFIFTLIDGTGVGQTSDLWIDNCKLQEGQGFWGYSREYENGWIVVNIGQSNHDFTVPDGGWSKILGTQDNGHNDGSAVTGGSALTVSAMDAYFLVRGDFQQQGGGGYGNGRTRRPDPGEPLAVQIYCEAYPLTFSRFEHP